MALLDFLGTSNTFRQWLATTNNLISTISNTSVFILVAQNATPDTTTGNVSINGTMTITTVTANGTVSANVFSGNGVSLTSLNATALASGTVPNARLSGSYTDITANNSTYAFGKSEGALNVNSATQATNATNLNSQPGSYYTNASNLATGTVPDARIAGAYTAVTSLALGSNVVANATTLFAGNSTANATHTATSLSVANSTNTSTLTPVSLTIGTQVANTTGVYAGANVYFNTTTIFVGNSTANTTRTAASFAVANSTNTATLTPVSLTIGTTVANTTTVSATNLAGNGASVTSVNAVALGGKTEANLNVNSATQATNSTNLNSQPGSYYTNASNLDTGTVPLTRLDANVILTTSTTGINASALSTGTVPDGRLSGAYTGVTSLALGANVIANVTTVFVGNSTANVSHTATSLSVANSTNTATLTPVSLTIGSIVVNTTVLQTGEGTGYKIGPPNSNATTQGSGTIQFGTRSSNYSSNTGYLLLRGGYASTFYTAGDGATSFQPAKLILRAADYYGGANVDVYIGIGVTAALGGANNFFVVRSSDNTALLQVQSGANTASGGAGRVQHVKGTVALPTITFIDDTSTGIYLPVTNSLSLVTGGVDRVLVNTSVISVNVAINAASTISATGAAALGNTLSVVGIVNALGQLGVSGNATFAQDVVIAGNLTVSGSTTYINTTNLQIGDNIIALNADLPAITAPTENAGIEINRGSSANTYLRWNEMSDIWEVTNDGTNYGTIIDTRSTTGINASALSTGTVPDGRLSGTYINITANNATYAFGKSEGALNVNSATQATNATNLNSQPGSYYTNASNLETGTVPLARLDANVILTTSTTGMNASALSTGTVPDGRIAGAYTGVTSLALGANVVANVTTVFVGNSTANVSHTATSLSVANSTNTATLTPVSLTIGTTVANTTTVSTTNLAGNGASVTSVNAVALGGKTETNLNVNSAAQATNATNLNSQPGSYYTNASNLDTGTIPDARIAGAYTGITSLTLGANVVANVTTVFVGNSTANVSHTATSLSVANSTNTATLTPISLTIGTSVANTIGFYAGANVYANTTTVFVGNSTANTTRSATSFAVANSTNTATLTPVSLTIGTSVANTIGFYAGANVYVNTTTVFVGNSTVNSVHTATSFAVANSTNTATLTPISLTIGTSVANTIGFYAGANVYANTTTVFFGNSTVNSVHTATSLSVANSTNTATLTPVSLTIGTSVANTVGFYAGANVYANTTTVFVGNSTINSVYTATSLSVANSTNTATLTPISLTIGTTVVNTSAVTVGGGTALTTLSSTGINASALSTGTVPLARLTSANSSANGVVDTTTQTFAGLKTFQNAITVSSTVSINSGSPTLYLQDTDSRSSMIHCNSNTFYVLRGDGNNSITWATVNGYWPMTLNLDTNDATFGGRVTIPANDVVMASTKRLYLDGGGDTYITESAANQIRFVSGGATVLDLNVSGAGYVVPATGMGMVTWPTSASGANAYVADGALLYRSTSSRRYKQDIVTLDAEHAMSAVMSMRPVVYRGTNVSDAADDRRHIGFIAEEIAEIAPLLATYDEKGEVGTPSYVTYDRITAYLVSVVQQQQRSIRDLEQQLSLLLQNTPPAT